MSLSSFLGPTVAEDVDAVEGDERLLGPDHHALLGLADPDAGVVELLVWLVCALGISNLCNDDCSLRHATAFLCVSH